MGPVGSKDVHAAWPGGEDIAVAVDLHAVGQARPAFFGPAGGVEQHAALAERAVGLDLERHPDGFLRIGLGDVERFFVGRKGDAVGRVISEVSSVSLPSGDEAVHAAEIELAARIVELLGQAVGRIGEIQIAVRLETRSLGLLSRLPW